MVCVGKTVFLCVIVVNLVVEISTALDPVVANKHRLPLVPLLFENNADFLQYGFSRAVVADVVKKQMLVALILVLSYIIQRNCFVLSPISLVRQCVDLWNVPLVLHKQSQIFKITNTFNRFQTDLKPVVTCFVVRCRRRD